MFGPRQSTSDLHKHKFLFDIDGNAWSGRFRRLMSTNSLVIKATVFPQWFQPKLIELVPAGVSANARWIMYVPARMDFTDLIPILAFFRGTPERPDLAFDTTAKAIAANGRCFVDKLFRVEDMQAYMFRLLMEWSDIVSRAE